MSRAVLALVFAAVVLTAVAWFRAPEYDEAYSIFLTAGHARPAWPAGIFHAGDVRGLYEGSAGFGQIAHDLRVGDVHPPLYFWALKLWRGVFGPSWFAARLLSVLFSLFTLAALGKLAKLAGLPAAQTILLALLFYGFAYTGIVARGFALAQLLNVLGVALVFAANQKSSRLLALVGGLALSAASFSNYLACFTGAAALFWLCLDRARSRMLPFAIIGFVSFIPADAYFFAAQKSSRIGQFVAFSWPHALAALGRDEAAAWFGGLPLYAGHFAPLVAVGLALLAGICGCFAVRGRNPASSLFLLGVLAPPIGLLALGLIFNNTPIEIRYLGFATPFIALLLAGALPRTLLALLLAVETCAIIGLAIAPATMQPQARAAHQAALFPGALVLLPFGNDGVGVPGPFLYAAPDNLRIELIRPGTQPNLHAEQCIVLVTLHADAASVAADHDVETMLGADKHWSATAPTPLISIYNKTLRAN